jgi:hypothetical protein
VELDLRNQMSALNEVLNRLTAWQDQLNSLTASSGTSAPPKAVLDEAHALSSRIAALKAALWNPDIQYNVDEDFLKDLPRFHTALQFNGFFVGGYAQKPAAFVTAKVASLQQELQNYLDRFNGLLSQDVPAFNKHAYAAGEPTLPTGKPVVYESPQLPAE